MPVAEMIGVVGSIIAIVQISQKVISLCQFYIDAVKGASSDLRVILIEVSALKGIAESLKFLTQPNVANSGLSTQLAGVSGSIDGCKKALEELEKLLPPTAASTKGHRSKRQKLDAAAAVLAWPLKAGKGKKLLQEIMQHKTTINLALTAEFVQDLKDVKQKAERIHDLLTESERVAIYTWLETTNPSSIHNRSQKLYEPGTASWMLRTPEWPLWIEGKHRCLWIHGIPGAGKSILASYLAEEIEKHCTASLDDLDDVSKENSRLGHAYYYCYFGHNQDESSHFLRWIIGQLCRQIARVPEELQDIYKSGKMPSLSILLSILYRILEGFKRVYFVLDAVDESVPRADLLRVIRDLSTDARFSNLGLLVTSRQYIDIEQVMESCSIPITMFNPFVEEDIRTLVRATVQSDAKYQRWPEDLRHEMQDTIPKKAKGMFRWAVCQLDILKRLKPDASVIKAALLNLPKTLDETYERIFLDIPDDDRLTVQHVFHWMVYHNDLFGTNISLDILLQAVQQSTTNLLSPDTGPLYDFEDLRERCGCLIMVEQVHPGYPKNMSLSRRSTISFAHYTVKEYLQSPRILCKKVGFFVLAPEKTQTHFAEIAFRQALAIQPNDIFQYYVDGIGRELIHRLLDTHFRFYCGVSSILQLNVWPEAISCSQTLMELSEALLDPIKPGHSDLKELLFLADHGGYFREKTDMHPEHQFWSIDWKLAPDRGSAIFLGFLVTSGFCDPSDTAHLALAFAKRHPMLDILTQQLHITKFFWNEFSFDRSYYEFIGSIPEIAAQGAYEQRAVFNLILDLISEQGATHFDLSTILLLYISCHTYCNCDASCALERLLRLGASANGPDESFVTPLQIAVACWDFKAIEKLLNSGANPNAVGQNGPPWAQDTYMEQFNHLNGVSSLHIIRNFDCEHQGEAKEELCIDETTRQKIEARLFESRAVDIAPDNSKAELSDASDSDEL